MFRVEIVVKKILSEYHDIEDVAKWSMSLVGVLI